jgi:hypothetical protein
MTAWALLVVPSSMSVGRLVIIDFSALRNHRRRDRLRAQPLLPGGRGQLRRRAEDQQELRNDEPAKPTTFLDEDSTVDGRCKLVQDSQKISVRLLNFWSINSN